MASDTTGSREGWRVDTVNVSWCQGATVHADGNGKCDIYANAYQSRQPRLTNYAQATPTTTAIATPTNTL